MVGVALELVLTPGGMFGSNTSQGNTEFPGYSTPEHSYPRPRCDLTGNSRIVK